MTAKPTHDDIYRLLEELRDLIGKESEDGKGGSGLIGRVIRIETKVHAYDELKQRAYGFLTALTVSVAIIWWLTKDRVGAFFGVHGP